MRSLTLASLALLWPALAVAEPKEIGTLVVDGVPDIPPALAERLLPYQNTRSAAFLDWEPTGKGLYVSTRFGNVPQLHFVAGPGMARTQLTFFKEPILGAHADPARPGGFFFQMDVGGGEFYQYFWYDLATGTHTLLTDGKSRNQGLAVASAGGRYAFTSTLRDGKNFDLYVARGDAKPKLVKQLAGDWQVSDWSPDDKKLLVRQDISINETEIDLVDAETGDAQKLSPPVGSEKKIAANAVAFGPGGKGIFMTSDEDSEFHRLVYVDLASGRKQVLTPELQWDVKALVVSPDRRFIAYATNEGGRSVLYVATTALPTAATKVTLPAGVVGAMAFDHASRRLGFSLNAGSSPNDAYVYDVGTHRVAQWTTSEVGGLSRPGFVTPSLVSFPSFDGRPIPAWVYKPVAGASRRPVIISIHGGPEGQEQPLFNSLYQFWVKELGAVVVAPNVRGSDGYGKSYLLLDNGFKREDSVKDIGALLDWIGKQPDLDPKRVAVFGGSYGGFMVLASLYSYPERIRCGVDYVGISNMITFLAHTEEYRRDQRRAEYGDEREPKMHEFLERIAPTTNAARIKSPLYIVQGANDPRVPPSESDQMAKTLRQNGNQVWYTLAKDEGHGFRKKVNTDFLQASVALFFQTYLLN